MGISFQEFVLLAVYYCSNLERSRYCKRGLARIQQSPPFLQSYTDYVFLIEKIK